MKTIIRDYLQPIKKDYLYQVQGIYIHRYEIIRRYKTSGYMVRDGNKEKRVNVNHKRNGSEYSLLKDVAIASVTRNITMALINLNKWRNTVFTSGLFFIKYKDFQFTYSVWEYDNYLQTTKGFRTKQRYFYHQNDNRPLRITEQGAFAMFIGIEVDAANFVREIVDAETKRVNEADTKFQKEYLADK